MVNRLGSWSPGVRPEINEPAQQANWQAGEPAHQPRKRLRKERDQMATANAKRRFALEEDTEDRAERIAGRG